MQTSHTPISSASILIVEDDENDSFMLMRELKRCHLEDSVTLMTNGHAARNHLLETSHPPLIVFLDLELPGIGGIELLQRIRQVSRLRDLPVVVMSGSINPQDVKDSVALGVLAFLRKPVLLSSFIHLIAHLFPERCAEETKSSTGSSRALVASQ